MKVVAIALAPLIAVMALVVGLVVVIGPDQSSDACDSLSADAGSGESGQYDADQIANARTIIAAAKAHGVPTYGWVVGIAAAIQESGLRNLSYGDRDSLGLFQQRPSMGWGTLEQLTNPAYASSKFFEHLLAVPGWQQMSVTAAAQAVQRSAFPDAYARHEGEARALVAQVSPDVVIQTVADTYSCVVATNSTVVLPLPVGSYRDLDNYGGTSGLWASIHTGDDLSAPCGTPVLAATAGAVVIEAGGGSSWAGRWLVKVETGPGALATWYGHMRALDVTNGQRVTAGQQIGEVGDLGNATGCHLHFEVHPRGGGYLQDQIDPAPWLAANAGQVVAVSSTSGSFRIASFNVLGNSHTGRSGDQHRGWPSGTSRIVGAVNLLDARGITIAGLQEFESPQHGVFARRFAGRWSTWLAGGDSRNAVIWRSDRWRLLTARSFAIPYINGTDQMPVVLLEDRGTGAQVYLVNVHNPSNMYGSLAHQRAEALRIESRLIDRLLTTGKPIVFTGDFNDKDRPVCVLTPRLHNAFGDERGRCGARPGESIDHIFGARVAFSNTTSDPAPRRQRISDHDLLMTTASTSAA